MRVNCASAVATALLAISLPLLGQEAPTKTWGPVFGLNRTTMGGSAGRSAGYETRSGFLVGLQTQRELKQGKRFFRSGFLVARRGGGQDDGSGNTLRLNLTYVEVPALIGVNIVRRPAAKVNLVGGLQGDLKLGCSFDFNTGGTKLHYACSDPAITFQVKTFDIAGVVGGGVSFPRERGTFFISGTYAWGLMSIDNSSSPGELLNRGASFSAGWLVERKRR